MTGHDEASGRFVLRLDGSLHAALRRAASEAGLSLNAYCVQKLALPSASVGTPATFAVSAASEIAGEALVGVAGFGSWARGELADRSDIDLLIVLDDRLPVDRTLYQLWDQSPPSWSGHVIEPHFVHLPPEGEPITGIWAEVAVEGIVLFERDLLLSRRLVHLRQRIATGEIVRRTVHGQNYWVEVA